MSDRAIRSVIRQAIRKDNPLRILTWDTHEAVQTEQCRIPNTEWYSLWWDGLKKWDTKYREVPDNYHRFDIKGDIKNIPKLDYDLILIQNTLAHSQKAIQISQYLHIPVISLEHCDMVLRDQNTYDFYRSIPVDVKIFITDYSKKSWGYKDDEAIVIYHGIDTDFFKPDPNVLKENHVLSVANDFVNRGPLLGFPIWKHIVKDIPFKIIGNTPGLSLPAKDQYELLNHYQSSTIFLNTSTFSPIPHSLLESAACGCAISTTLTCAIPDFFVDGVNCVASNNPEELKQKTITLLNNPTEIKRLGEAARQLILNKFNLNDYINNWNNVIRTVADLPYRGNK